jgi:uncharacterized protein
MAMNPVVHFEMAYEDRDRAAKFYAETFGWKTQKMGPEMGEYLLAQTDEMDSMGMLKQTNRINGGFYKKMDDPAMNHPSVVIAVGNLEESMKKITEAGGKLIGEAMDIPGIGKYISFYDTEGNRVGVLQPSNSMN